MTEKIGERMLDIDELLAEDNIKTVAITGHVNPDGDCIGAGLALKNYINDNYKEISVDVYLQSRPQVYSYLKGFDDIITDVTDKTYDLLFVCDCGNVERFRPFAFLLENSKKVVNVDHHIKQDETFADISCIDEKASATCEILYQCLDKKKIGKYTAQALYTGLVSDTGVFKYPGTSKLTMDIAGDLMGYGFNFTEIIDETFYARTFTEGKALGRALIKAKFFCGRRAIYSCLTPEELKEDGCSFRDLGGIVEQLRLTRGVEVALFIYPTEGGMKKGSLRSKTLIDVERIAASFGGGGHIRAAGFSTDMSIPDILDKVANLIRKQEEK